MRQGINGSGRTVVDGPRPMPVDRSTVARVLADVARLGPFFAVTAPGQDTAGASAWRPLRELDRPAVRALADDCARRFGITERRVAASILFQGLAARMWSPVVAAAAVHGVVPELSGLRWQWRPGASIALWLPGSGGWSPGHPGGNAVGSVDDLAELVRCAVVDGHLRPLVENIRGVVQVAEGLLWGNAASALAGTLYVRTERPELAAPIGALVGRLLAMEPLSGTGTLTPDGSFVRRSCCLYYRVPPGGTKCGDCVLLHPPKEMSGI